MNILTLATKVLILKLIAGRSAKLNSYLVLNRYYLRLARFSV